MDLQEAILLVWAPQKWEAVHVRRQGPVEEHQMMTDLVNVYYKFLQPYVNYNAYVKTTLMPKCVTNKMVTTTLNLCKKMVTDQKDLMEMVQGLYTQVVEDSSTDGLMDDGSL
jgi:hypothetical protein